MEDIKVYTAETIDDQPFPLVDQQPLSETQSSTGGTYSPATVKDQPIPKPIVAHETIGSSLNTKSKKIMQAFEFIQSGALQIGKYEPGVSGDMRISPNGMLARNIAGETTIAVDGDTGDVTIKGTLQAGSVIAGDNTIVMERGSQGGRIVLYNDGIPSIVIGDPS